MRALLVDDERLARSRLRALLAAHDEVEVVGEADSVDTAAAAITERRPDLVFLDISMPGGSGFDLLTRMDVGAAVVFVTAHDEHAIRAFDVGAIDYLLKPIEPERLASCLARIQQRATPVDRICLEGVSGMRLVDVAEILFLTASGDRCQITLVDGTQITHSDALARWEQRLGASFVRVHRKTVVALAHVERVEKAEGSTSRLRLRGWPSPIAVSRARVKALKAALR